MGDITTSDKVLGEIREELSTTTPTPQEFREVYEEVLNNPTLAQILQEGDEERQEKIQKLSYAKLVLSDDIYSEIGEEWITHPDMTLDKICTIAMSDPETARPDTGGLAIAKVKFMTGKWLAHAGMTVDKITLIEMFGLDEDLTAEQIAKMPEAELNDILSALFFGF